MLVRARPKRFEDLPEWAKCCENGRAHTARGAEALGEFVIDMSTRTNYPWRKACESCGNPYPNPLPSAKVASGPHAGRYTAIDWLELDEAPLEAA